MHVDSTTNAKSLTTHGGISETASTTPAAIPSASNTINNDDTTIYWTEKEYSTITTTPTTPSTTNVSSSASTTSKPQTASPPSQAPTETATTFFETPIDVIDICSDLQGFQLTGPTYITSPGYADHQVYPLDQDCSIQVATNTDQVCIYVRILIPVHLLKAKHLE